MKTLDGNIELDSRRLTKMPRTPDGKYLFDGISVNGTCQLSNNGLTSLEGCPERVSMFFDCSVNKLKTLRGCPRSVGGSFFCDDNELINLEGCSQEIAGNLYCSDNQLSSLRGCPEFIWGDVICESNRITTLDGFPKRIYGSLYLLYNDGPKFSVADIKSVCDVRKRIYL